MDNQHRKISGYRELSATEINLINEIKAKGKELGDLVEKISFLPEVAEGAQPARWAAMARTDFQVGIMKLVRAVAQPTDGL